MKKIVLILFLVSIPGFIHADDDPHDYQGDAVYWREQAEAAQEHQRQQDEDNLIKQQNENDTRILRQEEQSQRDSEDRLQRWLDKKNVDKD